MTYAVAARMPSPPRFTVCALTAALLRHLRGAVLQSANAIGQRAFRFYDWRGDRNVSAIAPVRCVGGVSGLAVEDCGDGRVRPFQRGSKTGDLGRDVIDALAQK